MAVIDPYRTLGLTPGATIDEVKTAYRRLAKRFHPDSAGPAAVPRFLEIQDAYEMLVDRKVVRPSTARPTRPTPKPRPSSQANGTGPSAQRTRPRSGQGATSGQTASGRGDRQRTGRRKATMGSTSYDEATLGPLDPGWEGASWYGTDSGTYWTVNPREYADPRKHGPEYQERARRAASGEEPPPAGYGPAARAASADGGLGSERRQSSVRGPDVRGPDARDPDSWNSA